MPKRLGCIGGHVVSKGVAWMRELYGSVVLRQFGPDQSDLRPNEDVCMSVGVTPHQTVAESDPCPAVSETRPRWTHSCNSAEEWNKITPGKHMFVKVALRYTLIKYGLVSYDSIAQQRFFQASVGNDSSDELAMNQRSMCIDNHIPSPTRS